MIQKLKLLILSFSSLFIFAAPLAYSTAVYADDTLQIKDAACSGTNGNVTSTGATAECTNTGVSTFDTYAKFALNLLSIIVGIAAVLMIIFAGFRYVTSGGKEEGVKNAKNTILYAIVGLVVVALAQVIVHFVLTQTQASGPSTQT